MMMLPPKSTLLPLAFLFFALSPTFVYSGRIRKDDNPTARDIHIVNDADVKVDIMWVHPNTNERVNSVEAGIMKSMDALVNSYIGHTFEVQEVKSKKTDQCRGENGECRTTQFTVTNNEDQKFTIQKDFTVKYEDSRTRALDKAKKVSEECPMPVSEGDQMPDLDAWAECLQQQINETLDESKKEIEFQASVRKNMGQKLVDYACNDEDFPASVGITNKTLSLGLRERDPKMQFLFESDTSKIILIDNFVARSQCKWIKESSKKSSNGGKKNTLEWASVTDAAIKTVVDRMYEAIGQSLGYKPDKNFLKEMAQRDHEFPLFELDIEDDTKAFKRQLAEEDDRHPLMATFMLFCDIPEKGGAVHFPKAGVHVKPKQGQALLVSYMDPKDKARSEDEFTSEMVECPVKEGARTTVKYQIPSPW